MSEHERIVSWYAICISHNWFVEALPKNANCSHNTFSFGVSHRWKTQGFIRGDRGGHNPRLMTHFPRTPILRIHRVDSACRFIILRKMAVLFFLISQVELSRVTIWRSFRSLLFRGKCEPSCPTHTDCIPNSPFESFTDASWKARGLSVLHCMFLLPLIR